MTGTNKNEDHQLRLLLFEALIPPGFRPESDDEIEAMLDALGGEEFEDDKVSRIVENAFCSKKSLERERMASPQFDVLSEENAGELLALHRAGDEELSPEIKAKLEAIRKKVQQEAENETNTEDDELEA